MTTYVQTDHPCYAQDVRSFFNRLFGRSVVSPQHGVCETCRLKFEYSLIHNGFADTAYAYCDRCGTVTLLSGWYENIPKDAPLRVQGPIEAKTERWLQACACGGTFRRDASPRCPHCNSCLSAELATRYLERNAPGTKKGWRWQRSWLGTYSIVIAGRIVNNNWRDKPLTPNDVHGAG